MLNKRLYHVLTFIPKLRLSQDTYQINDLCTPPEMRIQPSDIEVLLDTLREHHLVTSFSFPDINRDSDLPIWVEFNLKLNDHLSSIGGGFADPSGFHSYGSPAPSNQNPSAEYHNLPWLFLTGSKLTRGRRIIGPANEAVYSPRALCVIGNVWHRSTPGVTSQPLLLIGIDLLQVTFSCADTYLA